MWQNLSQGFQVDSTPEHAQQAKTTQMWPVSEVLQVSLIPYDTSEVSWQEATSDSTTTKVICLFILWKSLSQFLRKKSTPKNPP